MPIVTRTYVTMSFLTTAACALEIITPFNLYFNPKSIFEKGEVWRLVTNFCYFGNLGARPRPRGVLGVTAPACSLD